ncbi:hypothetical protein Tco_1055838 [Tanacetum coccineum]|uniref:Uncharacterized protein n=1 Tax=Tanacetum coccineum TaxID=301880 RepID=A0ABQ5H0U3_9ASTR
MVSTTNTSLDVGADEVFDETSMNKFLKRECTVDEYYAYFTSSVSNKDWNEWYLSGLFVFGLQSEIGRRVKMYNPKSLFDAYHLAKWQESMNDIMRKNSSTSLSSSSKTDHSKEVKEDNIELEFRGDGKGNEGQSRGEEINKFGVKVFDVLCEEQVEGIGMKSKGSVELDGKCLEDIDNFVNKDDKIEENKNKIGLSNLVSLGKILDELCEEKVEGIGIKSRELAELDDKNMDKESLDSSKDADTGEAFSNDIKIDSKGWVACDSSCEESEIFIGRMIRVDTVSDVPSLFQSTHDVYKSLTPSWKEKCNDDFKKENDSSFVGLVVTRTIVEKTIASTKMIQEKKGDDISQNQDKMNNSEVKKNMKRWDTKTSVNVGHQTQSGLSLKHSKSITTICNNYNITLGRRVGVLNMRKMGAFDTSLLQKSVKEATEMEPSFDHLMFDTWKWLKRKCQKMRQAVALQIYFSELFSKAGCGVKALMFKGVLKLIKGWLSVVTQKFEVQEAVMLVHREWEFDIWKWPKRKKERREESREGIKYDVVIVKVGKVAYKLDPLKNAKIHLVFYVSQLKKGISAITEIGSFPVCDDVGVILVGPQVILDKRMQKGGDKVVYVFVLVGWASGTVGATWKCIEDVMKSFIRFSLDA